MQRQERASATSRAVTPADRAARRRLLAGADRVLDSPQIGRRPLEYGGFRETARETHKAMRVMLAQL